MQQRSRIDTMDDKSARNGDRPTSLDIELDLHDGTIQALFGVGLKLEYCMALVDESPEQAKAGLDAAISNLSDLIETLRSRIHEIR